MTSHRHADIAMLVAIGCAAAVAATVWLWGGLAGTLFGTGWPRVGLDQLFGIVVRLPSRLSDPAAHQVNESAENALSVGA